MGRPPTKSVDLERIKRMAQAGVVKSCREKHNFLWEILKEFNITPENISNAKPPSYRH